MRPWVSDALKIVADVEFAWEVNVSVWQDLVEKTVLSSPRRVRSVQMIVVFMVFVLRVSASVTWDSVVRSVIVL